MRTVKVLLLSAMPLLGGCSMWSGPPFYSEGDVATNFPAGLYRYREGGKSHYARWDGRHLIEHDRKGATEETSALAVPLPVSGPKAYIVQLAVERTAETEMKPFALYALMRRAGNGWQIDFPDCATTATIVRATGGSIDPLPTMMSGEAEDGAPMSRHDERPHRVRARAPKSPNQYGSQSCHFPSRASLEAAMRRYVFERQVIGHKIERVGN